MSDVSLQPHTPLPAPDLGGLVSTLQARFPNTEVRVEGNSVTLMPSPEMTRLGLGGVPLVFTVKPEVGESQGKFDPRLKNEQGQDIMTLMLELIKYLNEQRSNLQITLGQSKMMLVNSEYLSTMSQADKQVSSALLSGVVGVGLGLTSAALQFGGLKKMGSISGEIDQIGQDKLSVMRGIDPNAPPTPRSEPTPPTPPTPEPGTGGTGRTTPRGDTEIEMEDFSSRDRGTGGTRETGETDTGGTRVEMEEVRDRRTGGDTDTGETDTGGTSRSTGERTEPEGGSGRTGGSEDTDTGGTGRSTGERTEPEGGTGETGTPETGEPQPMSKEKRNELLQELQEQRDAKQREFFEVEQRQRAMGALLDSAHKGSDAVGGLIQADATRAGAEAKQAASSQAMVDTAMQVVLQQTSEAHQSLQQATITYLQTLSQVAGSARTV